jgi:hypothetical protein
VADDVNMNEVDGKVALEVVLPTGKSSNITVDSRSAVFSNVFTV